MLFSYGKRVVFIFLIGLGTFLNGCIETFPIEASSAFESALVVEATITNEEKQQAILLSRSYTLDTIGPSPESNALVKVIDDKGNEHDFLEIEPGRYLSSTMFAAQPGIGYQLIIKTSEGGAYRSETQVLPSSSEIDEVYPVRETNDFGEDGMSIYVDATGTMGTQNFFRYEYEETFKIVAPFYNPQDIIVVNDQWPNFEYDLVERQSRPVCYGNRSSSSLILTNTDGQVENRIRRFQLKFLSSEDYVISHRYSILVKQYSQSSSAYSYYKTLRDFSQAENPFSENQPGFLEGNILSENNSDEKIIGFFDVSAVIKRRMFFNYTDFYPDEPLPPYPSFCSVVAPNPGCSGEGSPGCIPSLIRNIREQITVYYGPGMGYEMVPFDCGDCTKLGSNTVPDFWEEE